MKRIIAILLSLLCVFALCACGDNGAGSDEPLVSPGVDDPQPTAEGMENPVKDVTPDTIFEELGLDVSAPEGAEDVVWTKIDGKPPIAQLDFKLFGFTYCFRAQTTGEAKDISGVTFQNPEVDDSNIEFTMTLEGDKGVVTWFTDGVSYSVFMDGNADFDELLIIHDEFTPDF